MCDKMMDMRLKRLTSFGMDEMFEPTTAWVQIPNFDEWTFNLFIGNKIGTFKARPGYQLAAVRPDNAGTPTAVGTASSSTGWIHFQPSPAVDVGSSFFWRFGVFYSGAAAGGGADVQLQAGYAERGKYLGAKSIDVRPYDESTTDTAITPVTGWFANLDAKNVKSAIIVNSLVGGLKTRLYRRVANDMAEPSTWVAVEPAAVSATAPNSERNTTENLLSATGFQWAQLGLGVQRTGGVRPTATIHVASATTDA